MFLFIYFFFFEVEDAQAQSFAELTNEGNPLKELCFTLTVKMVFLTV